MTRCTIARSGQVAAKTNRQGIATLCREKCRDSRISAIRGQESRHSAGTSVAITAALSRLFSFHPMNRVSASTTVPLSGGSPGNTAYREAAEPYLPTGISPRA